MQFPLCTNALDIQMIHRLPPWVHFFFKQRWIHAGGYSLIQKSSRLPGGVAGPTAIVHRHFSEKDRKHSTADKALHGAVISSSVHTHSHYSEELFY